MSQNGGPFTLFIQNTTATSRVLNGVVGSTYAFYSIARDRAGNTEGAKTLAEATVTIVSVVTPPPVPGNMSGSGFVEPAGTKWHFVFGAGAGTSSLQVWANGPGKRFIATSASALFLDTSNVRLSGTGTWNGVGEKDVRSDRQRARRARQEQRPLLVRDQGSGREHHSPPLTVSARGGEHSESKR